MYNTHTLPKNPMEIGVLLGRNAIIISPQIFGVTRTVKFLHEFESMSDTSVHEFQGDTADGNSLLIYE